MSARKLQRRSHRSEAGAFLLEGPVQVLEALAIGAPIDEVFVEAGCAAESELISAAGAAGAPVTAVTHPVLASIAETNAPQGVVAVVRPPAHDLRSIDLSSELVLMLADVRDPGNAGTLVRSALAAGAAAVVFGRRCVDPWNPKAVRAASGAVLQLPVVRDADLAEAAAAFKDRGFRVVGADVGAATAYDQLDLTRPIGFLLGNEAWGLADDARDLVDDVVSIPMPGPAESLNVSIAGSILLFEAVRQRRGAVTPVVDPGPGEYPQRR